MLTLKLFTDQKRNMIKSRKQSLFHMWYPSIPDEDKLSQNVLIVSLPWTIIDFALFYVYSWSASILEERLQQNKRNCDVFLILLLKEKRNLILKVLKINNIAYSQLEESHIFYLCTLDLVWQVKENSVLVY